MNEAPSVLVVSRDREFGDAIVERLSRSGLKVVGWRSTMPADGHPAVDVIVLDGRAADSIGSAGGSGPHLVVLGGDLSAIGSKIAASHRPWGIAPATPDATALAAMVRVVAAGFTVMPADASPHSRPDSPASPEPFDALEEALTPRERDVLELVALGLSNHAIGTRLHISDHTVKFHLSSIFSKLGVRTRTGAVRRGLTRGLIAV